MVADAAPTRRARRSPQSGWALAESIVAMTIAAVIAGGAMAEARNALVIAGATRQREEALTAAHDAVETAVGAPCGPPFRCPDNLVCDVRRSPLGSDSGVPRFLVSVVVRSAEPRKATLAVLRAIGRADCP